MMDALTALTSRTSAVRLAEPGPTEAELEQIMEAAVRAPDHGRLRPWRFILVEGDARARFGDLMAESLRARDPEATEPMIAREREKPFRAPTLLVLVATVDPANEKIPAIEQVLSAGASAQNVMLAAHALGLGGMWRTGSVCYDKTFKDGLGLKESDEIVGILYLGRPEANGPLRPVDWRPMLSRL